MKRSWRAVVATIICMALVFESQPVYALDEIEMQEGPIEEISEDMPEDMPDDINDEVSAVSADDIISDGISVSENTASEDVLTEDDEISRLGESGTYKPYDEATYLLAYETISGDKIRILECTGTKSGKLVIPDTIEGKPGNGD